MKISSIYPLLAIAAFMVTSACNNTEKKTMNPPIAKKIPTKLTKHGHSRTDNYFWLKERKDTAVINYLKAENAYTEEKLKHTKPLQEKLYNEIIGRIKQTDMSVPYKLNGYYYYTRYEEGKEYPVYCRKKNSLDNKEEIMLNVNEMAKGFSYYQVGDWDVSTDNKLIAFSVDTVSRRKYTIHVKNLETGEIYTDAIQNTSGSVTWANDNKTLYYAIKDETLRPFKISTHVLGSNATDRLVYHEEDPTYTCHAYKTKSKDFMVIGSFSTLSSEYRILDANNPEGEFRVFHPREKDFLYYIDHFQDKFFIRTNWNAKNFRLMQTPVNKTSKENWEEVIAHRGDVLLDGLTLFNNFMVLSEKQNGLDQLRIIKQTDHSDYYIGFDEEVYMAYVSTNPEFDTDVLRFGYSSLTTPNSVFDFNMVTRQKELMKQQEVIGGFNPDDYQAERLFATSEDGAEVPISLVYKKGLKKDGSNPLLVYAYGSYGYSIDPNFNSVRLSLLDRGFVYAIAHVRGGQVLGRQWYEDGKLLKKKNTFTDFIACTEHLIDLGYSSPDKCFALGGSAGGLLMGAIVNMRPELYKGVVAAVPFVDVITTMLDESIPLTTGEYDEWGNPNDKEYYDYILSYSPYDQVKAMDYPNLLVTTGLHDSQVQYWEPAKWVAKLRDMKTDNNELLLFTQMEFGHSGASGRFERYKETAMEYAFVLDLAGIKE